MSYLHGKVETMTKYLNSHEAAKYLRVGKSTLERWRINGDGPRFYKLGRKIVRYTQDDLDIFQSKSPVFKTSDYDRTG